MQMTRWNWGYGTHNSFLDALTVYTRLDQILLNVNIQRKLYILLNFLIARPSMASFPHIYKTQLAAVVEVCYTSGNLLFFQILLYYRFSL